MNANFPRAIVHFDGDAFFASVEQMMNYKLRGKPVITGGERGAATSLSYEAKKRGIHRGMRMSEIRIRCPEAVIVTSDYRSYGIYAHRMYSIVRTYTEKIEEYSIDECFADITGLDEKMGMPYEEIVMKIKDELEDSLGITFGVGLAPNKTLAKIASKANKPAGFTVIPLEKIKDFLEPLSIHSVWGLGGASGQHLAKLGADTAYLFAQKPDIWLTEHHFGKAYRDVWLELNGHFIKKLTLESLGPTDSIMSTRTFTPPSVSRSYIFSQLSKNVERACEKARNHNQKARGISFFLKTQEFTYHAVSIELTVPTADPTQVMGFIDKRFDEVYAEGVLYRASGVTLRGLISNESHMLDLFGEIQELASKGRSFQVVDTVNKKYGRQTMFLGSSLQALTTKKLSKGVKSSPIQKKTMILPCLGTVY